MTQVFVEPDGYTFVAFLSACSSFEDRLIGKVVHVLVYRKLDCLGGNVLLVNVEVARRLFDQMGGRDVVSWTAMISGYCHAGCFQEALELFVQLEELRMEPDEVVAVAPLSACAWLGALELGRRIHHKYDGESWQCGYHRGFACAVVDMYAKCGSIDTALDVFVNTSDDMKTTFLYNSIVSGLAHHGRGKRLFESMLSEYGVNHQMEHYGCMIDLLSRAGHLNEAYRLIQNMLLKANAVIWRALLSASLMEKNDEAASVRKAIDNVVIQKPLAGATWK
ncbi:Pentatricopeptide repeat-containing protein [Glycine max]|nr:Pentatricopeptide repeat-containing protein [Glycine max]